MNPAYLDDPDLADATFGDLFAELHAHGDRPPVPVGPALQRLFDGQGAVPLRRRPPLGRGPLIGLAVVGTVAGGVGAAAANELPRPLQRVVSTVVNTVTPFDVPTGSEQEDVDQPPVATATVPPNQPSSDAVGADGDEDSSDDSADRDRAGERNHSDEDGSDDDSGSGLYEDEHDDSEDGDSDDERSGSYDGDETDSDGGEDSEEDSSSSSDDESSSDEDSSDNESGDD